MASFANYSLDIVLGDGTTHYTRTVVLLDDQYTTLVTFLNYCVTSGMNISSYTLTISTAPVYYDALRIELLSNLGVGDSAIQLLPSSVQ